MSTADTIADALRAIVPNMTDPDDRLRAIQALAAYEAQAEAKPADTDKIKAAISSAGLTLVKTASGHEVRNFGRIEAQAEAKPAKPPVWEVSGKFGTMLFATEAAADAWCAGFPPSVSGGFEVVGRHVHGTAPAAPAHVPLTDAELDAITEPFRLRIFGTSTPVFTEVTRELARAAIAASKGEQA